MKFKEVFAKMLENGNVNSAVNSKVVNPTNITEKGLEILVDGIKIVAAFLVENNEVFVLVAIIGMIIVITGRKEFGTKLTSGSILAYVITMVVSQS